MAFRDKKTPHGYAVFTNKSAVLTAVFCVDLRQLCLQTRESLDFRDPDLNILFKLPLESQINISSLPLLAI